MHAGTDTDLHAWAETTRADLDRSAERELGSLPHPLPEKGEVTDQDFHHVDLRGMELRGIKFTDCTFDGTEFHRVTFNNCSLQQATFTQATVTDHIGVADSILDDDAPEALHQAQDPPLSDREQRRQDRWNQNNPTDRQVNEYTVDITAHEL